MRKAIVVLLWMLMYSSLFAQSDSNEVAINFQAYFNQKPLVLNADQTKDSISISTFKCYVGQISFTQNKRVVWSEKLTYHLLNAAIPTSNNISLKLPKDIVYNGIQFLMGIDSATSVSGAMGGDLDPTNGMYWAWKSGYIHFKLEGYANTSSARDHSILFHLGGYQSPFQTSNLVSLPYAQNEVLNIDLDLNAFLKNTDLAKVNRVMSEGSVAHQLAKEAVKIFSIHEK